MVVSAVSAVELFLQLFFETGTKSLFCERAFEESRVKVFRCRWTWGGGVPGGAAGIKQEVNQSYEQETG